MLRRAGTFVIVLGLGGASLHAGAARRVLETERCQTELPRADRPPLKHSGGARVPSAAAATTDEHGSVPVAIPLPSPLLLAALLAVVLAVAFAYLVFNLPSPGDRPLEPEEKDRPRDPPLRTATIDDADRLAREGRFGEAIHALLLRALVELGRGGATPALTSREILRATKLAPEGREALGDLVRAVEWAHFGAKPAESRDYEACRVRYGRFREAWRAGA